MYSAEAAVALQAREYIWTTIATYYALFHFSIALMFLLPRELKEDLRNRLTKAWSGGSEDPTSRIRIPHQYVPEFLQACEAKGLTTRLRAAVEAARELREHVNYGPRIAWVGNRPVFQKSLAHAPQEVETITNGLESLLETAIRWVTAATDLSWARAAVTVQGLRQFLMKDDLLYVRWCSPEVLAEAKKLATRLPHPVQVWREKNTPRKGA